MVTCAMELAPCISLVRTYLLFLYNFIFLFPLVRGPFFLILPFFFVLCITWLSHTYRTSFLLIVFAPSCGLPISLPGLALGGLWGFREGARRPLAVSNARLRINSILNSVTRRGTFIGNSAGVLG